MKRNRLKLSMLAILPMVLLSAGVNAQMHVDANGNVGVGTMNPISKMDILGDDAAVGTNNTTSIYVTNNSVTSAGRVMLALENNGTPRFSFNNTSIADGRWVFSVGVDASYRISKADTAVAEFRIDAIGDVYAQGTFNTLSDRDSKTEIQNLDSNEILEKVVSLPLSSWSYKDNPSVRHIGPMAQDFYASFKLGGNDKSIATIDATGVALSAIQALAKENDQLKVAHKELLAAYYRQEQKMDAMQQTVNMILESTNGKSVYTSLK